MSMHRSKRLPEMSSDEHKKLYYFKDQFFSKNMFQVKDGDQFHFRGDLLWASLQVTKAINSYSIMTSKGHLCNKRHIWKDERALFIPYFRNLGHSFLVFVILKSIKCLCSVTNFCVIQFQLINQVETFISNNLYYS